MEAPKIQTAIPQRRYQFGEYTGVVLGEIESSDAVKYQYILALVREGESISIDAERRLLQLNVSDGELEARRAAWSPPAPRYTRGVLAKFATLVSSASRGAITDGDLKY